MKTVKDSYSSPQSNVGARKFNNNNSSSNSSSTSSGLFSFGSKSTLSSDYEAPLYPVESSSSTSSISSSTQRKKRLEKEKEKESEQQYQEQQQQRQQEAGVLDYVKDAFQQVYRIRKTMKNEELPWFKDFLDREQFELPKTAAEAFDRLNLNLPYYAANYAFIFYTITLPFLLLYDPLFFVLLFVSAVLVHSIHLREKKRSKCGAKMRIGRFSVLYQHVADFYLVILFALVFFWDGIRTVILVLIINSIIILPHAIWRRPTYFDDEELEKLRPKMVQYFITLILLFLAYLECKGAGGGVEEEQKDKSNERAEI